MQAFNFQIRREQRTEPPSSDVVAEVQRVLSTPDSELDYATAKIAFDALVEPQFDRASVFRELDDLTEKARDLARGDARPSVNLGAVRLLLYESGPWNDHRPFGYDQSDPAGRHLPNKLLHNYLRSRRGQCVSMPILFLILAKRLGLSVALASAPEHVFLRYTDENGRVHNLETTSGAHPARDDWYRQTFPITSRSLESGIYLRSLSMREGVALMASTAVEHLNRQRRFDEVAQVCEIILHHSPRDVHAMLWLGTACGRLLDGLRVDHPHPRKVSPEFHARAFSLMERNRQCFATAEQVGWAPFQ